MLEMKQSSSICKPWVSTHLDWIFLSFSSHYSALGSLRPFFLLLAGIEQKYRNTLEFQGLKILNIIITTTITIIISENQEFEKQELNKLGQAQLKLELQLGFIWI